MTHVSRVVQRHGVQIPELPGTADFELHQVTEVKIKDSTLIVSSAKLTEKLAADVDGDATPGSVVLPKDGTLVVPNLAFVEPPDCSVLNVERSRGELRRRHRCVRWVGRRVGWRASRRVGCRVSHDVNVAGTRLSGCARLRG